MTDVMKEKLNPLVEEYRRINSKWVFFLLEYWVFCTLQTFVKQEKKIRMQFKYFFSSKYPEK